MGRIRKYVYLLYDVIYHTEVFNLGSQIQPFHVLFPNLIISLT